MSARSENWARIAPYTVWKVATARSCASASAITCPQTSAATWTYQIVFGESVCACAAQSADPKRSHPRPSGSLASRTAHCPPVVREREVVGDRMREGDGNEAVDEERRERPSR